MQKFDNRAYRIILQLPINTAISFLRGESGASTFISRDMKNKIKFLKHSLSEHGNALLKEVIKNEISIKRKTSWTCTVMKYLEEINLKIADINKISTLDINKKVEE